jgi:hypothetical protein
MEHRSDFYVAPFAIDGELAGIAPWALSSLSPRWLGVCRHLIARNGDIFTCNIPQQSLSHISIQVTSSDGAALVTIRANDEIVSSAAALAGNNSTVDAQVLNMFVSSLRAVPAVGAAAASAQPFEQAFRIAERPLYVVVPWASRASSQTDLDVARELNNHFAGALLSSPAAV